MKRVSRRRDTLFIDTNLLLVLLVGTLDPDQVERFKRTRAYSRADHALLIAFADRFSRMATTPNVLTEVSNLLGQLREPLRRRAMDVLAALTGRVEEEYTPSRRLVADPAFAALGLADISVVASADEHVTVLTADLALYLRLASAGIEVVNFNHLRTGAWP